MSSLPTITARIAFASDPMDAPSWSDVSSLLLSLDVSRGRLHELNRIEAGRATLVFRNDGGEFWPENSGGTYYPNVKKGKRLNLRVTYSAVTYDLFTGFITSYRHSFLSSGTRIIPIVTITAVDLFKLLNLVKLNDLSAQFTAANNEFLSRADNADLSITNQDFCFSAWVMLDTIDQNRTILSKGTTVAGQRLYTITFSATIGSFYFDISSDGTTVSGSFVGTGIVAGQWYHLFAWQNVATGNSGIRINNTTEGTVAWTGGWDDANTFYIGYGPNYDLAANSYFNGRISPVGFWKRLLSDAEVTTLYNSGRRTMYADLTAGLKTSLVSWWDLTEASGNRADSHGSNTLTDGNTVTQANGYPSEASDQRIIRILQALGWTNYDVTPGVLTLQATTLSDTNALTHLLDVVKSEGGLAFVQGDGDLEFQNRYTRAKMLGDPYATFGDDAGEMAYQSIQLTDDDTFVYNDIHLTRTGGTEQIVGNLDSQADYGQRTLTETGYLQTEDTDILSLAQAKLMDYREPPLRIESITIDPRRDPTNLWPKVLGYDLSTYLTLRFDAASLDVGHYIEHINHRATKTPESWQTIWQLTREGAVAWTNWTPTVTQSGAVPVTVDYAKYCIIGKRAFVQVKLTCTGAGTGANDIVVGGIPAAIALASPQVRMALGSAHIQDTGTRNYGCQVIDNGDQTLKFLGFDTVGGHVGTDPNFALANTDLITFEAGWEIA